MTTSNKLSHTATRYLQAIETLSEQGPVKQIQVAKHLSVSPSTCFEAILRLLKRELIAEDEKKSLSLTPEGKETLKIIQRNQYIFTSFFRDVLGRCCSEAEDIAAEIEPILNLETSVEMCRFTRFLEHIKGKKVDFWAEWEQFYPNPEKDKVCLKCAHRGHCLKKRQ